MNSSEHSGLTNALPLLHLYKLDANRFNFAIRGLKILRNPNSLYDSQTLFDIIKSLGVALVGSGTAAVLSFNVKHKN